MATPSAPAEDDAPIYPTGGALAYRTGRPEAPERRETTTARTFHVPAGDHRFRDAMTKAFERHAAGQSTRLVLAPGVYRDHFRAEPSESKAEILIEAREPGRTIIRGSDVWTDWQKDGVLWRAEWPHAWGFGNAPDTFGDPYLATGDLMRRREMVFIDGALQRQVLTRARLEPGTFFVDEPGREILLHPAGGDREAIVEIGIRSGLLEIAGRRNVTLRGLRFEHDASFYHTPQRAALQLANCRHVRIEDCSFDWNNTKGLQVTGAESEDITLRRVTAHHNGCLGILASRVRRLLLEDCATSFNNWRGAWAGKFRGSPCGIKIMHGRGVALRRHQAIRNLATGIWIDEDNRDVHIESGTVYGNYRGIHLEAGGGPVLVENTTVCANRQEPVSSEFRWAFGSGIALTHMPDVTLRDNFLADNDTAQVGVRDDREARVLADSLTGKKRTWRTERLVMENNTLVAGGLRPHLLRFPSPDFDGGKFHSSLCARGNTYLGGTMTREVARLEDWQKLTGQDRNSTHEQP